MWSLFEDGKLGPETELTTACSKRAREAINLDGVLHEIESAQEEAMARRARLQAGAGRGVLTGLHSNPKTRHGRSFILGPWLRARSGVAPWRQGPWWPVTAKARMTTLPVGGGGANGLLVDAHEVPPDLQRFGQGLAADEQQPGARAQGQQPTSPGCRGAGRAAAPGPGLPCDDGLPARGKEAVLEGGIQGRGDLALGA